MTPDTVPQHKNMTRVFLHGQAINQLYCTVWPVIYAWWLTHGNWPTSHLLVLKIPYQWTRNVNHINYPLHSIFRIDHVWSFPLNVFRKWLRAIKKSTKWMKVICCKGQPFRSLQFKAAKQMKQALWWSSGFRKLGYKCVQYFV